MRKKPHILYRWRIELISPLLFLGKEMRERFFDYIWGIITQR